jgi:tetratricopeptide (TPR) repeat protein
MTNVSNRAMSDSPDGALMAIAAGHVPGSPPGTNDPNNLNDPFYGEAVHLVALGDYLRALNLFNQVLEHRPNNVEAWSYIGYTFWTIGRLGDAQLAYREAQMVSRNPNLLTVMPPQMMGAAPQASDTQPIADIGPTPAPKEDWQIQLAVGSSEDETENAMRRLRRENADLLGLLTFDTAHAHVAEGDRYLLRAGPLDETGANRLCLALEERRQTCMVVHS